MHIISKKRYPNGRRHIYLFGLKVISYQKHINIKPYVICGYNNKIIVIEKGHEQLLDFSQRIKGFDIEIKGNNNIIKLNIPEYGTNNKIIRRNDDAYVEIGTSLNLNNLKIICTEGHGQICKIGNGITAWGLNINLFEKSGCIIGNDCMFSSNIEIWPSDAHSILDMDTNVILNEPKNPIIIGDHVWVGQGARIHKNAKIYKNSIIGGGAICCKDYKDSNVVIAGNPAQIIKRNITWNRLNPYLLKHG